ncbi:MAG TPA: hypothetical protein PKC30_06060 [Saprospiraceae bacterium]|nr:hypothetical protein [Saprospiraceae bacterium]
MQKNIWFSVLITLTFTVFIFQSCEKETAQLESNEIENLVEEALQEIALQTRSGSNGCYEFIFPIKLQIPGRDIIEVSSYKELKEVIRKWASSQRPVSNLVWPHVVFPYDVMTEDGSIVTVSNREELAKLRRICVNDMDNRPPKTAPCFNLLFPIILDLPNGNSIRVASREELNQIMKRYKEAFPNSTMLPKIGFPFFVHLLESNRRVQINNEEELKRLRAFCGG